MSLEYLEVQMDIRYRHRGTFYIATPTQFGCVFGWVAMRDTRESASNSNAKLWASMTDDNAAMRIKPPRAIKMKAKT